MKSIRQNSISSFFKVAVFAIFIICAAAGSSSAQDPRIQTSSLDHLASKAEQTVDVSLDASMMRLAAMVFDKKDADEMRVKQLVEGLKGIYVRSFEFEKEGEYLTADLDSIRSQLRGSAWSRLVNVSSKKEGSVEIYLMSQGSQILGLAVLAYEPKEITVVNILGDIDLQKLSELEGNFGVPDLGIDKPKKKNE